jgi:transposase
MTQEKDDSNEPVRPSSEQQNKVEHNYSNTQKQPHERASIIKKVVTDHMPQAYAAKLLGVSVRQVQRLAQTYREEGKEGMVHKLIGQPSNNKRLASVKEEAVELIRNVYPSAGPTLGAEMLAERHNIVVSKETMRRWLIEGDLWVAGNIHSTIRRRRTRRASPGDLIQLDTSMHQWFHGDDSYQYLIASKDDATGRVFARFYPTDSTQTNMDFMKRYIQLFGFPVSFYLDHASHFSVNLRKAAKAENQKVANTENRMESKAEWKQFTTQIQRACKELDIKLTFAGSPEAKGRIEREYRTLQDRLVKLMRWDNILTMDEGNDYLESFLEKHNNRFMVKPAYDWNLHRSPEGFDLDAIFSIQETRIVGPDNVVRYDTINYQLLIEKDGPNLRGKKITVELRLNGSIKFRFGGKYYSYRIKPGK